MSSEQSEALAPDGIDQQEYRLRRQIEEFYLPRQLVDSILEIGGIPRTSMVSTMGVAFMDIADYTFISKFLSPQENQEVLNGLYTAFNSVLKRHGGYLNKIEGDSLMFHYGGVIDPNIRNMTDEDAVRYIARELFYTCIEMQRVCLQFNQANDRFLTDTANPETREVLTRAFEIIANLRSSIEVSSSFNALFQIRIRIGANIGDVTIGNFGPDGAKQWDIIGLPVIEAKRMEATAPVGGLRISEGFFQILERSGVVDSYYQRFKKEAQALFGYYRGLSKDDLFRFSTVTLKDKKDAEFRTYSIEVNPGLPENIRDLVALLLERGEAGADRIVSLLQYYRGNRFVIQAVEDLFSVKGVVLRKDFMFKTIYPRKYEALMARFQNDAAAASEVISRDFSLFFLLEGLGRYQDTVKRDTSGTSADRGFQSYEQSMAAASKRLHATYEARKRWMVQNSYFYNVVFPLVFEAVRSSVIEYQNRLETLEPV